MPLRILVRGAGAWHDACSFELAAQVMCRVYVGFESVTRGRGDGRRRERLEDVRRVSRDRWDTTPVRAVMTPVSRLATLPPDADAPSALEELTRLDVRHVPVVEDSRIVGMLRRRDLCRGTGAARKGWTR